MSVESYGFYGSGDNHDSNHFENCLNMGNITGNGCIGGIVGSADTAVVISNCKNTGSISGKSAYGDICGYYSSNSTNPA